ncbi:MAG: hypothetical protein WA634_03845 [Silvibacterium sp.]
MNAFGKLSLAFAIAGLAVAPSGVAQTGKKLTIVIPASPGASCPVAMRAAHGVDGSMRVVKDAAPHGGQGQQLELTLYNAKPGAISAVQITAHGWDGTGRTLPAREASSNYATAAKTLELKVSVGSHESAETDVWVSGLTAVDSIDLVGVSYADGSSWTPAASEACSVAPDLEMLISLR